MRLFLKNKIYHLLTVSRFLNTIDSFLHSIVFVVYAATAFHSKVVVGITNATMVVPTLFITWIGIRADQTQSKRKWIIIASFIQIIIFILLAFIINEPSLLALSFICLFNILSDVLSDFSNGLWMLIIQRYVHQENLTEACSFTQFVSYIYSLSGQALSIWLLTVSKQNFSLVAFINVLSFLLSVLVILLIKDNASYGVLPNGKRQSLKGQFPALYHDVMPTFSEVNTADFSRLLLSVLCLNMLGGSLNAIYNIWLLTAKIGRLSCSQTLLLVEFILVGDILIGGLTPHDYFFKKSVRELLKINAVIFFLVGLSNLIHLPLIFGVLPLAFVSYLVGKVSLKINSLLLSKLPVSTLAQTNNFLSFLSILPFPVGIVLFSNLSSQNVTFTWLTFLIVAAIIFRFSAPSKTINTD